MIAIDTNVLVRVLVDDPEAPDQCKQARELLLTQGSAWIAQIVLVETVWVLKCLWVWQSRDTERHRTHSRKSGART